MQVLANMYRDIWRIRGEQLGHKRNDRGAPHRKEGADLSFFEFLFDAFEKFSFVVV